MFTLTTKQLRVAEHIRVEAQSSPWVMRITNGKGSKFPTISVCERYETEDGTQALRDYGHITNTTFGATKRIIRYMMSKIFDKDGRQICGQDLIDDHMAYRGDIPLDETTGAKLALLAVLSPAVKNLLRIEFMGWRIDRFSREEALYWLGKVTIPTYGEESISWARSGLRIMLAGDPKDMDMIRYTLDTLRK